MNNLPNRKSPRLPGFDYSAEGTYFVTGCTHQRTHRFGEIHDGRMRLSREGAILEEAWADTLQLRPEVIPHGFVAMPNHFHALFSLDPAIRYGQMPASRAADPPATTQRPQLQRTANSVGSIISGFKGAATRRIREVVGDPDLIIWQGRFHDRIVRNEREFDAILEYIRTNPERWAEDRFHT